MDLPAEVYSVAFQHYLAAQLKQVLDFRFGRVLSNDQLQHFRAALTIKEFQQWSYAVDEAYCAPIFSNLEDVEDLEDELRHGDFNEFTVQCCAIAELCLKITPKTESIFMLLDEQGDWLFGNVQTLTDIAARRQRLQFPCPSFKLRVTRDAGMLRAIEKIVECNESSITWQEIIMLFRVSDPEDVGYLLVRLAAVIERIADKFPIPALSLLLCYVAEGVDIGTAYLDEQVCQKVILALLARGASLMVSWDGFSVLKKSLKLVKSLKLEETPWWLTVDHPTPETENLYPTSLNRLLSFDWPDEFLQQLRLYSCCSLDTSGEHKKKFGVRMASLQCLAAQNLPKFQLEELPSLHKLIASKHNPIDL